MKLKAFQQASADTAIASLKRASPRRFLVADEVGLGKTVVAREVVQHFVGNGRKARPVFYFASNLTIARQNGRRLLSFLSEEEMKDALIPVDRLSLAMHVKPRPSNGAGHKGRLPSAQVRLFVFTPETSVPLYRKGGGAGRLRERAIIYRALASRCRAVSPALERIFRGRAKNAGWSAELTSTQTKSGRQLRKRLFAEIRTEFGLKAVDSANLNGLLQLPDSKGRLIARFRTALARAVLARMSPELVVFDEFQKFRGLFTDEKSCRLARRLRGDDDAHPVLLLSATPYPHFTTREEDARGVPHQKQFTALLKYLFGSKSDVPERITVKLEEFRTAILAPSPDFARMRSLKEELEAALRSVMTRTERPNHAAAVDDGWSETPDVDDYRVYRHWAARLHGRKDLVPFALPFWFSIPYPSQMVGKDYVAYRRGRRDRFPGEPALRTQDRNRYRTPVRWPHPQLRKLAEVLPVRDLVRPWQPPTLTWWELAGLWQKSPERRPSGKLLVFSRFKAVPPAIASLLSFGVECEHARRLGGAYESKHGSGPLQSRATARSTMALFYPVQFLIDFDPSLGADRSLAAVHLRAYRALRTKFREAGIAVRRSGKVRPLWRLLAGAERRFANDPAYGARAAGMKRAWLDSTGEGRSILQDLLDAWNAEEPLAWVTEGELSAMAKAALDLPGVALSRALRRFDLSWLDDPKGRSDLMILVWNGLRNYLNRPLFKAALGRRGERYTDSVRRAVVQGNLEAVLDEHIWITRKLNGDKRQDVKDSLWKTWTLVAGRHTVYDPHDEDRSFWLRCHAVLPFADAEVREGDAAAKLRTDILRNAFNSPFWPHVLATTSVGQEGLDFHVWCRQLLHWDLPGTPLDLEQREGRIQRFGGLVTRAALADARGNVLPPDRAEAESPWVQIERSVDAGEADETGMQPWWGVPGHGVNCRIIDLQNSEHRRRLERLARERTLYRLALGQPHQQDFLDQVSRYDDARREFTLDLRPVRSAEAKPPVRSDRRPPEENRSELDGVVRSDVT